VAFSMATPLYLFGSTFRHSNVGYSFDIHDSELFVAAPRTGGGSLFFDALNLSAKLA
jgi:hypothetical protein